MKKIKLVMIFILLNCMVFSFGITASKAFGQDSGRASITKGWDIFGEPLSFGEVTWRVTGRGVKIQFELRGAKPTHSYTVGVHLFNPYNKVNRLESNQFGGYLVGDVGVITREGNTAYTEAWDFGQLYTNGNGDGFARFDLSVPPGTYYCQFTVRIGGEGTCLTSKGITHGCAVVYRTGERFAQNFETIRIGGSSMGGDTGRSYTAQPYGQTQQPYGRSYTAQPYGRQYTSPPVSIQPPPEQPIQQVQPPPPPPPPRQDEDEFTKTYRRVDEFLRGK